MRVRIRFVLVLTLVVSIILIISFYLTYSSAARERTEDFNNRLWSHAYNEYVSYFKVSVTDDEITERLNNNLPGAPADLGVLLLDSNAHIISAKPDSNYFTPAVATIRSIHKDKEFHFTSGNLQGVGLYINNPGAPAAYAIAVGYDKYGIARLESMKVFMFFNALGAIVLLGLFTFFYVLNVTKPLVFLSEQMRRITETNLKHRVDVQKGNKRNNEIVRIASNFNGMLDRLEKAFNMQKNFVQHASHDLRTPLATMLSQTESALRRDLSPSEAKRVLESLKEDQQGMIELTNSLLLLAQYENISYTKGWPSVRLDEVVYDSISSMHKMFPEATINFEFVGIPEEETLNITGNEVLLRSAFLNLLKNGTKYSVDNRVNIFLETKDNKIEIRFENRGPVMQPDEVEKMFFPFFRGNNSQQKKGFGLGLSIVKRIVELHKCDIHYRVKDTDINCFILIFFHHD